MNDESEKNELKSVNFRMNGEKWENLIQIEETDKIESIWLNLRANERKQGKSNEIVKFWKECGRVKQNR